MTMTARKTGGLGAAMPETLREVAAAAGRFQPVSLHEIGSASLMDRVDTKFVLPALSVAGILESLGAEYRVLEVSGRRLSRYSTRYFDTPDLRLYHAHHAGRARRYKVRVRTYVDSEARFLEVKLRTNRGRTTKQRVSLAHDLLDPMQRLEHEALLGIDQALSLRELRESMVVDYTRVTLVRRNAPERITLDLMVRFSRAAESRAYPGVVIAELKQARRVRSPFLDALRAKGVRAGSLSKYCLGITALAPEARTNRFRGALRRLETTDGGGRAPFHA
jgi:hypothetical protein